MRISDWSSDVCSSDLSVLRRLLHAHFTWRLPSQFAGLGKCDFVQFLPVLKHRSFAGGPVDAVRIFLNEVALPKLGCSSSHFHHRVTIARIIIQNGDRKSTRLNSSH